MKDQHNNRCVSKEPSLSERLGTLFIEDLDIESRDSRTPSHAIHEEDIDKLAIEAAQAATVLPLVYTAFDGDHQLFSPLMRSMVMKEGKVPVNPDSVLNYYQAVKHRLIKRDVLLDDLSVLRRCDELWVFTDILANIESLSTLAEGALIELLFFLKRRPESKVYFVSCKSLAINPEPTKQLFQYTYEQAREGLALGQKEEILGIANSGLKTDSILPVVVYHVADLLDFKFAEFIRPKTFERAANNTRYVPLIPYLTVSIGDQPSGIAGLGYLLLCWLRLSFLADECVMLPSVEPMRRKSLTADILYRNWTRAKATGTLLQGNWRSYQVPKVIQRDQWAITKKESAIWCQESNTQI